MNIDWSDIPMHVAVTAQQMLARGYPINVTRSPWKGSVVVEIREVRDDKVSTFLRKHGFRPVNAVDAFDLFRWTPDPPEEPEPAPEVGMGATYCIGNDKYAMTIVEVSKTKRKIVLQHDAPHRKGERIEATLRTDGRYREKGVSYVHFIIGKRLDYWDPSF